MRDKNADDGHEGYGVDMQNDLQFAEDGMLVLVMHGRQTETIAAETIAAIDAALAGRQPNSVLYLIDFADVDVEDGIDEATALAYQTALMQELAPGSGPIKYVGVAAEDGSPFLRLLARVTLDEPEFTDPARIFPTSSEARAWLLARAAAEQEP